MSPAVVGMAPNVALWLVRALLMARKPGNGLPAEAGAKLGMAQAGEQYAAGSKAVLVPP